MAGSVAAKSFDKDAAKAADQAPELAHPRRALGPYAEVTTLQHMAGNGAVTALLQGRAAPTDAGRPLDAATRVEMEQRFSHDFSQVRVHTDTPAASAAAEVNAKAYTIGSDVVFGEGHYAPETHEGQRLLAHELAHVVQQSRGGAAPSLDPGSALEQAAAKAAGEATTGSGPVDVAGASGVGMARAPDTDSGAVATAKRRIAKAVVEIDKLELKVKQAGGNIRAEDAARANDAIRSALARAKASNNKALMGAADTLTGRFATVAEGTPFARTTSLFQARQPGGTGVGATGAAIQPYRDAPNIWSELNQEVGLTTTAQPATTGRGATGAARSAQAQGLMEGWRPGEANLGVQPYSAAGRVKRALNLARGKYEALHLAPKAAFEGMPGYQYEDALTFIAPKKLNSILDQQWKSSLRQLSKGGQKPTVGQVYDMVVKSIHSQDVETALRTRYGVKDVPGIQGAMHDALRYDLFERAGLNPGATVSRSPFANLWGKAGKVGSGGLVAAGAALEYHQLRQSGHGRGESAAQAIGGGLGSLAAPGGKAGLGLGLGAMGLGALGAPKSATTPLQTAGDVLNFTGSALGQTARAGVNLVQGDMKAFDRQMKEMEKGEAGMPLEGLVRWVGMEADTASIVIPQVKAVAQGQKGAKQAWGETKDRLESMVLKQKFGEKEEALWGITGGPILLRQIKLAEGLAQGKSLREAAKESQQVEKNALTNKAVDWASEQTSQFVKKDMPEAVEFAKKDIQGAKDQLKGKFEDTKKKLGRYWPF